MVKSKCQSCGKVYETPFAWYKKRKHHFCSRKCMGVWRSRTIFGANHPQYKRSSHRRICKRCKRVFVPHNKRSKFCSYKCKGEAVRGRAHTRSKDSGHTIGYIHNWLSKTFGKATKCENYYCENRSTKFEWSCIHEKGYEKNRKNFWMLCKRCHIAYDAPRLPVSIEKNIKTSKWQTS